MFFLKTMVIHIFYTFFYTLYCLVWLISSLLIQGFYILCFSWHKRHRVSTILSKIKYFFIPFASFENKSKKVIWLNAVSVGESIVAKEFIRSIFEIYEDKYNIVITLSTQSSYKMIYKNFLDQNNIQVIYMPLDFRFLLHRFIATHNLCSYIGIETDMWPNVFHMLDKNNIPIYQMNTRISDTTFKRLNSILMKRIYKEILLNKISKIFVQRPLDKQRLISFGMSENTIEISGSIKSSFLKNMNIEDINIGFLKENKMILGASTHEGEEKILIHIYKNIQKQFSNINLILCPRHPERIDSICSLIRKYKFNPVLFSSIHTIREQSNHTLTQSDILIIDKIGILHSIYYVSDYIFVGKSLSKKGGGQNIMEPCYMGKIVFVGPYVNNFKEIVKQLQDNDAIFCIHSAEELQKKLTDVLMDSNQFSFIGKNAKNVLERMKNDVTPISRLLKRVLK